MSPLETTGRKPPPEAGKAATLVKSVVSRTRPMFSDAWVDFSAASCTFRLISEVDALCWVTADAIVPELPSIASIVRATSAIRDATVGGRHDRIDLGRHFLSRLRCLGRKVLDLSRHYGKALAGFPGAGRLDRGIERQEVGLRSDVLDELDDLGHPGGNIRQFPCHALRTPTAVRHAACLRNSAHDEFSSFGGGAGERAPVFYAGAS